MIKVNNFESRGARLNLHFLDDLEDENKLTVPVIVKYISIGGVLLQAINSVDLAQNLTLRMPGIGSFCCSVVWRSDVLLGCTFDEELTPGIIAAAQLKGVPLNKVEQSSSASSVGQRVGPVGLLLKNLRRQAGMTLEDVALALNVSKPTVWAWEKGKANPLPERLNAIAALFDVDVENLSKRQKPTSNTEVIDYCRAQIAEVCGAEPAAVRIVIEV